MAAIQRIDPYRNFKFRIEIDGIQTVAFSEASIPSSTTEVVKYREGTDPNFSRKLGGLVDYGSVSLRKGLTDSLELYNWRKLVEDKGPGAIGARKNISLILLNEEGEDSARWDLFNAWPSKYEASGFNASSNDVMIETFEVVIENMTRVK
ncbi:MAG: phage tail protein [Gammaproteobacteria bacterium]|jgi:phage tail-like protein|nr:phage tail protein [Gammaproteobacteria bacterium]